MNLICIDPQMDFLPRDFPPDCKCLKDVAAKMAGELDRLGAVDVPQHPLWPDHCIVSNPGMDEHGLLHENS